MFLTLVMTHGQSVIIPLVLRCGCFILKFLSQTTMFNIVNSKISIQRHGPIRVAKLSSPFDSVYNCYSIASAISFVYWFWVR